MVFIFEGTDCVGKSTITTRLSKELKALLVRESYTPSFEVKEARKESIKGFSKSNQRVIYDRATIIDDFVYGFLNTEDKLLNKEEVFEILKNVNVIHLELNMDIIKERFKERGDEYVDFDQLAMIQKKYREFYQEAITNGVRTINFVRISGDLEEDVKLLKKTIDDILFEQLQIEAF